MAKILIIHFNIAGNTVQIIEKLCTPAFPSLFAALGKLCSPFGNARARLAKAFV